MLKKKWNNQNNYFYLSIPIISFLNSIVVLNLVREF